MGPIMHQTLGLSIRITWCLWTLRCPGSMTAFAAEDENLSGLSARCRFEDFWLVFVWDATWLASFLGFQQSSATLSLWSPIFFGFWRWQGGIADCIASYFFILHSCACFWHHSCIHQGYYQQLIFAWHMLGVGADARRCVFVRHSPRHCIDRR